MTKLYVGLQFINGDIPFISPALPPPPIKIVGSSSAGRGSYLPLANPEPTAYFDRLSEVRLVNMDGVESTLSISNLPPRHGSDNGGTPRADSPGMPFFYLSFSIFF